MVNYAASLRPGADIANHERKALAGCLGVPGSALLRAPVPPERAGILAPHALQAVAVARGGRLRQQRIGDLDADAVAVARTGLG